MLKRGYQSLIDFLIINFKQEKVMNNLPTIFKHRENFVNSFDKLFDQMIAKQFPTLTDELGVDFFAKSSYPKVDILDYPEKVEIVSEIPGLNKKDIQIEIKDGVLTISGKKSSDKKSKEKATYLYRELKHSSFKRSFTLGENLNEENVEAKFQDGILTINIAKTEPKEDKSTFVEIK